MSLSIADDWRHSHFNEPTPLKIKPDAQGRVPMDQTLVDGGGLGSGDPLRAHYAKTRFVAYPSVAKFEGLWAGRKLVIVGGGYSLKKSFARVRQMKKLSKKVCIASVNKSHDWLIKRGIIPDFGVLVDPRKHVINYMTPHKDVMYLLGLSLDDAVFEKFEKAGAGMAVWVPLSDDQDKPFILKHYPPERGFAHAFISGLSTVGFRTVSLGSVLGFTDFELHGFDSCYAPFATNAQMVEAYGAARGKSPPKIEGLYAYDKPESDYEMHDFTFEAHDGATFRFFANNNMAIQARQYAEYLQKPNLYYRDGAPVVQRVKLAGDGVIPWMAYKAGMHADMAGMDRKYAKIKDFDYRCVEKVTLAEEVALRGIEQKALQAIAQKRALSFSNDFTVNLCDFDASAYFGGAKEQGNSNHEL